MIGELLREPDISLAAQLTNQPENELTIKKKKKKTILALLVMSFWYSAFQKRMSAANVSTACFYNQVIYNQLVIIV